jgi:hypothetical protein
MGDDGRNPPIDAELDRFSFHSDGSFTVGLALEGERYVALDFARDSRASSELLDLFTQLATEALSRYGERGVVITAPIAEDET